MGRRGLFQPSRYSQLHKMIQIIVLDLLMFDIREIKIFNTNFFITDNIYYEGYVSSQIYGDVLDRNGLLFSLAVHDKVTQINLIRNLWKNGICKVDSECEKILATSNEELMEKYEELYP